MTLIYSGLIMIKSEQPIDFNLQPVALLHQNHLQ